ncbi:head maturation protease, ClpP-related [Clostridium sp. Mt-5]|uniref:ATP-dependent Clp protease proteolytic subunit n=1 Tax=Clostridium moutaii TaxID=3240932 RepID=A0ABV4BXM8_9CLOT
MKVYEFTRKDKTGKIKNVGKMQIKNQDTPNPELYFYGDIVGSSWDAWQSEDMCPQDVQDFLSQLEGTKNLDIYINSGGGDVFGGLAIYNMLKRNTANKTVHVDGLAASIASVIALAGDTIIIPSTAQFMVHNPWSICIGNANDMRKLADDLDTCNKSILAVYQENLKDGVNINTIQGLMDNETWMTGKEAAQYFNIQVEENANVAACTNSEFFSRYKNVPENLIKQEPKEPEPPKDIQNDDKNILKKLDDITSKLDEVENRLKDPPKEPEQPKNDKKIEQLKAKLALEIEI